MTKKEYIEHWKSISINDWKVAEDLFQTKHYLYALFFAHLVLEKLCKAHWIKDNTSNFPPKIHNLNKLISQSKLKLSDKELTFCADINKFVLEGRYPDYISNIYKIATKSYTQTYLKQCEKLKEKLKKELP